MSIKYIFYLLIIVFVFGCNAYKQVKIPGIKPYQPIGCNFSEAIKVADTDFYSYVRELKFERITEGDTLWKTYFTPDTACYVICYLNFPTHNKTGGDVTYWISRKNCKIVKCMLGE